MLQKKETCVKTITKDHKNSIPYFRYGLYYVQVLYDGFKNLCICIRFSIICYIILLVMDLFIFVEAS